MELYRGDIYYKNKYTIKNKSLNNLIIYNLFKFFLQKHILHKINNLIKNLFFDYRLIIFIFILSSSFRCVGFLIYWHWLLIEHRLHSKRSFKFFQSMPVRFQRTRTNAQTTQKYIGYGWEHFADLFFLKRRSIKARKNLSKKKNKIIKKINKIKKTKVKGPVKRTRDSKKSVWG